MDINNMIAVIQIYIAIRKDVEVELNLTQFENPLNIMSLHRAYSLASQWMQENKVNITPVR